MKGEWKNNVSGWNHKDIKRKKQTHKNRLRDNGRVIYNKFNHYKSEKRVEANPEVFRVETETVLVKKGTYNLDRPIVTKVKVFKVFVTWNQINDEGNFILNRREKCTHFWSKGTYWKDYYNTNCRELNIYSDDNYSNGYSDNYYVEGTSKTIGEFLNLSKTQTRSIEVSGKRNTQREQIIPEEMINKAIERKNKIIIIDNDSDGDFMYGKPLPSWRWYRFYDDGKRRKYAQKLANRMDRRNIKAWINKKDISIPLKTHHLSKSIAWEIH